MSTVSRQTVTHVAPQAVYAPTAVSARVVLALVYIIIAERTYASVDKNTKSKNSWNGITPAVIRNIRNVVLILRLTAIIKHTHKCMPTNTYLPNR